jgi:uncharacterized membrane protein
LINGRDEAGGTSAVPPGWRHNPSAWSMRVYVLVIALIAFGIAVYLALYQWGIVAGVWEPFFGNGSRRILKDSALAHFFPVPDAALGALAYLIDASLALVGGQNRWHTRPGTVLLQGSVTAALVIAAIVLVLCQGLVFRAYCTLCLASALCSLLMPPFALSEVWAAWQFRTRPVHPSRLGSPASGH